MDVGQSTFLVDSCTLISANMNTNLRLCQCQIVGCGRMKTIHPQKKTEIWGQYIPRSTWNIHRELQQVADASIITESFANMTVLSTVASTDVNADQLSENLPPPRPGEHPPSHASTERPTVQTSLSISRAETKNTERHIQDILHLGRTIDQRIEAFTPPRSLKFKVAPSANIPYVTQMTLQEPSNTGVCALDPKKHPDTAMMVGFESWLLIASKALTEIDCCGQRHLEDQKTLLGERIAAVLRRLDTIKQCEWERQVAHDRGSISSTDAPSSERPIRVDTDSFRRDEIKDMDSLPLICIFIVSVLHILCHVSRDRCNFVLVALRYLLLKALGTDHPINEWYHQKMVNSVPGDVRTALAQFDIEPRLIPYVCCPKCCALYPQGPLDEEDKYPEYCLGKETHQSGKCGARLRKNRFINGKLYSRPIRTYLYQDLATWMAKMVNRPGFESMLEQPLRSLEKPPPEVLRDIWDGPVVRNFLGPDGGRFFEYKTSELRLLFSLAYDNFNPYHNKQAGKKVSVGVIFMVCLNLPSEVRFKWENIYAAGIVPGPKQPSLTQINHFLRPLVDQLEIFWKHGFEFSRTPLRPTGRSAKGALIPVIADLHAARQISSFGSFSSRFFCTFCGLLYEDIEETDPTNWPAIRTCEQHRLDADAWRTAANTNDQESLFEENGVRWSELLRLEYWDPSRFTVFDSMHGWYLNAFGNHVRNILGVDRARASGDGTFVGKRPARPAQKELLAGLQAFKIGTRKVIDPVKKQVLYYLCETRNLRRAGGRLQMQRTLQKYYSENPASLREDIAAMKSSQFGSASDTLHATPTDEKERSLINARLRLTKLTHSSLEKDGKYLATVSKANLLQLAAEWGIEVGSEVKGSIVKKLLDKQIKAPVAAAPKDMNNGQAVLGADAVKEIDADIARSVLPSWVASGPSSFGASEHGKLKADEWRTTFLIRLAITLPRIWGPRSGRHQLMLENFMHLASAVIIGSSLGVVHTPSTTNGAERPTATLYQEHYQAYMDGIIDAFPTATFKPNMHIAYHIGELLENFGPVHSWRCFVFERFIGLIQNLPTNMRFGELEGTFMRSFCMAANLKGIVEESDREVFQDLREAFHNSFSGDATGAQLYDLLGLESRNKDTAPSEASLMKVPYLSLEERTVHLLASHLNSRHVDSPYGSSEDRTSGKIRLEPRAWALKQCQIGGVLYRRVLPTESTWNEEEFAPHRDSYALVRSSMSSQLIPCSIQEIFVHRHLVPGGSTPILETHFIVRRYLPLEREYEHLDPWRKYSIAGGCLYRDQFHEQPELVSAGNMISHFVKTPYEPLEVSGIDFPCIHVLPLNWHNPQLLQC